ncbi:MAG: sigma-70 family RNA polymerase sigma factor [Bryobacteraceae bacterium]
MPDKPEIELIEQSKQGDQAAMTELFGRHYPASLRVARGILRSEDESQDAVQAAYISAFQHLNNFRGDACFKTWITRIVVNCCFMQLREPRRRVTWVDLDSVRGWHVQDILTSAAPTPERAAWWNEITVAFSDAVARLPKHLREAYALYSVSGLSLREVAAALGLTVPATKTRLFRARHRVRVRLQPMWPDARPCGATARSKARRVN